MNIRILTMAFLVVATGANHIEEKKTNEDNSKEKREAPKHNIRVEVTPHGTQIPKPTNRKASTTNVKSRYSAAATEQSYPIYQEQSDGIEPENWNSQSDALTKLALQNINFGSSNLEGVGGLSLLMSQAGHGGIPAQVAAQMINSNGILYGMPHASLSSVLNTNSFPKFEESAANKFAPASFAYSPQSGISQYSVTPALNTFHSGGNFLSGIPMQAFYDSAHLPTSSIATYPSLLSLGTSFLKANKGQMQLISDPGSFKSFTFDGGDRINGAPFTKGFKPSQFSATIPENYEAPEFHRQFLAGTRQLPSLGSVKFTNNIVSETSHAPSFGHHYTTLAPSNQGHYVASYKKSSTPPLFQFLPQMVADSTHQASTNTKYSFGKYSAPTPQFISTTYKYVDTTSPKYTSSYPSFNLGSFGDNTYNTIKYSAAVKPPMS